MRAREMAKAIVGALVAGLSVLAGAVGDGVSAQEWITAAVAALGGLGLVYVTPNAQHPGLRADPGPPRNIDRGAMDVVTLLVIVLLVVVILAVAGVL
jgi:hypothetical protein